MSFRPLAAAIALAACNPQPAVPRAPSAAVEPPDARRPPNTDSTAPSAPPGVRFIAAAADGDAATLVRAARARAAREGRVLLVYVGATWCEPCQHFHHAVEAHQLDESFPRLTLVEFDLDRDRARLGPAGYLSQSIPLFAVPGPDGRSSGRHMEGSVQGEGSVQEIVPRLRALIGG